MCKKVSFEKILLLLLPIYKQRPKSKYLRKIGTNFLRMKLHLVSSGKLENVHFSCCQFTLNGKDRHSKANKNINPHSLRQWKGAPASRAANLGDLRGRNGSGSIFLGMGGRADCWQRASWRKKPGPLLLLVVMMVLERLDPWAFPGQTDEAGLSINPVREKEELFHHIYRVY